MSAWTNFWFYWLLLVGITWLVPELLSVYEDHGKPDWILSDTIRRWQAERRWLAPVVVGVSAFLLAHFFLLTNGAGS